VAGATSSEGFLLLFEVDVSSFVSTTKLSVKQRKANAGRLKMTRGDELSLIRDRCEKML